MHLSSLLAGLGLGFSLIIAIGAQNLFVLRQGIRREHVFAVAAICALSDFALIVVGVSGVGAVLEAVPWLIDVVRWAGAAFLLGYGLLAARRVLRPSGEALVAGEAGAAIRAAGATGADVEWDSDAARQSDAGAGTPAASGGLEAPGGSVASGGTATLVRTATRTTLAAAIGTCLALTWLNPHVYLDTVFLLGSVANTHGEGRWAFAAGAGAASIIWFFALAYGSRLLGGALGSPRAWRILDGVIAVVMIALAVSLVLPH